MRLIDLSVTIEQDAVSELVPPKIEFRSHTGAGLAFFKQAFGITRGGPGVVGGGRPGDEIFTFMSHTGTHVDAPFHYGPTSADGTPAKSIDELPLEWFHGDGVVLDLRHKEPGDFIEVSDLEEALAKIDYELKPMDIVLLWTGTDRKLHSKEYFEQPGMGRDSTLWLVRRRASRSSGSTRSGSTARSGDARGLRAHRRRQVDLAGALRRDRGAVLPDREAGEPDAIPRPHGFKVSCFPIKVKRASAGFARVVAFVEE